MYVYLLLYTYMLFILINNQWGACCLKWMIDLAHHFLCLHLAFPAWFLGKSNLCAAWDWFYYNIFTEFLFFSIIFLIVVMIAVFGDFSFFFVFYFVFPQRQWVILEVLCNLFCSADFLPCMYCVFSFFQLSFQILLPSGNHFHLFQFTAW